MSQLANKFCVFAACLGLMCLLLAYSASHAQSIPSIFKPNPPVSGESIFYRINHFVCPILYTANTQGERYLVQRDQNEIHLYTVVYFSPCGVPPGGILTAEFNLGLLPEGDYTLIQYYVPVDDTFPINTDDYTPVGELDFSVGQGPRPVPVMTGLGLALLMAALLVLALIRIHRQKTDK